MSDIKTPLKLSRSKLETFRHCPRCFWLEMNGKAPPIDMAMGIYNILDTIQKNYYDKHRKDGLPPLLKGKIPFRLADFNLVEKLRKGISFKDEKLNATLWGKLDDCFIDNKERLVVMDNKTSSGGPKEEYEDSYQFQLDTYAYLLVKNSFDIHPDGYLIYFIPDKESHIDKGIMFDAEAKKFKLDHGRIYDVFKKAVATARKEEPPAQHKECEMCAWVEDMGGI